jgi:hypothetical protein
LSSLESDTAVSSVKQPAAFDQRVFLDAGTGPSRAGSVVVDCWWSDEKEPDFGKALPSVAALASKLFGAASCQTGMLSTLATAALVDAPTVTLMVAYKCKFSEFGSAPPTLAGLVGAKPGWVLRSLQVWSINPADTSSRNPLPVASKATLPTQTTPGGDVVKRVIGVADVDTDSDGVPTSYCAITNTGRQIIVQSADLSGSQLVDYEAAVASNTVADHTAGWQETPSSKSVLPFEKLPTPPMTEVQRERDAKRRARLSAAQRVARNVSKTVDKVKVASGLKKPADLFRAKMPRKIGVLSPKSIRSRSNWRNAERTMQATCSTIAAADEIIKVGEEAIPVQPLVKAAPIRVRPAQIGVAKTYAESKLIIICIACAGFID